MSATAGGHSEVMDLDELESFLNSDPREFKDTKLEEGEVFDFDLGDLSVERGAPRGPKAMLVSSNALPARKFKTPSGASITSRSKERFISAEKAWATQGQDQIHSIWAADGQLNDMGDYVHNRRGHHGPPGHGHRRGGGGRKRRFQEYDDDQEYGRRPPRNSYGERETPTQRVRRHITTIADSPMRDAKDDVRAIAIQINDNAGEERFIDEIQEILVLLVVEQPLKIPHVAGMILNLNKRNGQVVEDILKKFAERAQAALKAGEWRTVKLVLRLFACVHGLFEGDGLFTLLEDLFNRAVDLQTASSEDVVGLEMTKIILLTIPFVLSAPCMTTKLQQKAADILEKTEVIALAPTASEEMINPYISVNGEEAPRLQPVVKLLQGQLRGEEQNHWKLEFIPKFFDDPTASDSADGEFSTHQFPAIQVPVDIPFGNAPLYAEVYLSLYADQDVETVPPTSHLASSIFRDVLVDTVNCLDFNREASAKYLIELDCYLPPNLFAKRATPFDRLKDAEPGQPTWKAEDLAVDAVFSQLLKLPCPEHKEVYYHSIITACCTIAPQAIAPSLGRAIRFLYRGLSIMDLELGYRFMDWFAHHLSNFDFRWKWPEWTDDVDLSPLHARKAFILGVLDKEVRLSFAKRIRDSLPEGFQPMVPASRDNDIPLFKYNDATHPNHAEAQRLVKAIKGKQSDDDIKAILDDIVASAQDQSTHPHPHLLAVDAFATTICYIGSKSLSHALSFIERYRDRFLALSNVDVPLTDSATDLEEAGHPARIQIVKSIIEYWVETQTGVAVALTDKSLNYGIISPKAVIDYTLGASDPTSWFAGKALPEAWRFEVITRTLGKVSTRVLSLVTARADPLCTVDDAPGLEQMFKHDQAGMQELFKMVDDVVTGVAEGNNDRMMEEGMGEVMGDAPGEREVHEHAQLAQCQSWGAKWRRVFRRQLKAIEKAVAEGVAKWGEPRAVDADIKMSANGTEAVETKTEEEEEEVVDVDGT